MFPLGDTFVDVTIMESLVNSIDKGKCLTLHFSSSKQTDTVAGSCEQAAPLPPP